MVVTFRDDLKQISLQRYDVGLLRCLAALRELQADFSKEGWRDELPDISEVSGIMRRLQANEVELGDAQKTVNIEILRNRGNRGGLRRRHTGAACCKR